MAEKTNDLIEKIRLLINDEAADVAKQFEEISIKLEKAKVDLFTTETKIGELENSNTEVVTGLSTRLGEVEQRERNVTTREQAVIQTDENQKLTAQGLILREQAITPQEEDLRQRSLELSNGEAQVVQDAQDLVSLRDELRANAEAQLVRDDQLSKREAAVEEAKLALKAQASAKTK